MIRITLWFLFVFFSSLSLQAQVRKVTVNIDEILTVKAALGIATIIQLPDTIQSAIIGDQSGFKIEYLDRAVTIKPLRMGIKTNLYLVTDKRRYNVRLVTLSQGVADYIVYIKNSEQAATLTKWLKVGVSQQSGDLKLTIDRIGNSREGFILIDAKLSSETIKIISIKPSEIEIIQDGKSKVINGLFLSDLKVVKGKAILIGISLTKSDLIPKRPLTVILKSQRTLSITLSEVQVWK
ncbi:MAG: hypothetical protein B7Y39_01875 [Bdellovibrio sp. 28-41-41]|nr:MAG: hypothetical protein B7Y39_01875 [Bdellovibrio sp. 28-41-41]